MRPKLHSRRPIISPKKAKDFKVGDFVLVHFPPGRGLSGANKKFTANWRGVYRIRKQLGPTTFLVGKSHGRSTKVPADRLNKAKRL